MSILASILISILASGLTFHSLPTESAGTNIETVCQDSLGNMWFGGRDGLTLYDGSRYTSFRHNAEAAGGGIPDNRIYKIVCDSDGRIWVAHMSGLSVYDHAVGDFRSYASPDGAVEEVLPLGDSRFLTATGKRLWYFTDADGSFSREGIPGELKDLSVNAVICYGDTLCFGTLDGRIATASTSLDNIREVPVDLGGFRVNCLLKDADGPLWVGTEGGGLWEIRPDGALKHYQSSPGAGHLSYNHVRSLCMDGSGRLWIGTKNGLNILEGDRFEVFYHNYYDPRSITHNSVYEIFRDKQGTMWLGTYYGGVCYSTPRFSQFRGSVSRPGEAYLNGNIISDIAEAADGSLWIGTNSGDLNHLLPDGRFEHIRTLGGEHGDPLDIKCIYVSPVSGKILLGADLGGLAILNPVTRQIREVSGGRSLSVYAMTDDGTGKVIVGASEGVFLYDEHSGELSAVRTKENITEIKSIMMDRDGILWIGRKTGVSALQWESGEPVALPPELGEFRYVEDVMEDSAGRIWFSSSGALLSYDRESGGVQVLSTQDGLPDNVIHGVEEDADGMLWISTNNGLYRLDPSTGEKSIFTEADGLPGDRFSSYAHCRASSGEIYFGGLSWMVWFDPSEVAPSTLDVRPVIAGIEVNGVRRAVPVIGADGGSREAVVSLKPRERDVTFLFSIPDYISGRDGKFYYRMDGVDTDWHEAGVDRKAAYHGLSHGNYTFRLDYRSSSGIPCPGETTLRLRVAAFWYETLAARIVIALLLLLVVVGYFLWLISKEKEEHQSEMEKFRNELLQDFSLEFVSLGASQPSGREDRSRQASAEKNFGKGDEEFMRNAVRVVKKNLDNPDFSVPMLASEMNMSRSNLHLRVKALFGVPALEFIKTIRLNEACRLLHEKKYSIAEIAYMTGFATPSYFASAFRRSMGVTPTEYIRKQS
ncbi:MAG: helix-turn-helix domain-containing protein [Bacteroidales bacterium]|nr:helix-turn-helix domain-containing protein [Bacteroidales bacterium]